MLSRFSHWFCFVVFLLLVSQYVDGATLVVNGGVMTFDFCNVIYIGTLCWTTNSAAGTITIAFQSIEPGAGGWLGIGFSQTPGNMLGSEAVVGWVLGTPSINDAYLDEQTSEGQMSSTSLELTNEGTYLDNGAITLLFTRPLVLSDPNKQYANIDPVNENALVVACGTSAPTSLATLTEHTDYSPDPRVNFAAGTVSVASDPILVWKQKHAALMTLGFGFFLPLGILSARFLKGYGPIWFNLHRILVLTGLAAAFSGWVIALTQLYSDLQPTHRGIGMFAMAAALTQPFNAFIRPHPPAKGDKPTFWRSVWQLVHHWNGRIAFIAAIINCYVGFNINTFQTNGGTVDRKYLICFSVGWATIVGVGLALEVWTRVTGKQLGENLPVKQVEMPAFAKAGYRNGTGVTVRALEPSAPPGYEESDAAAV